MNTSALVFQSTTFDIIDRSGQPWLRGNQIAQSLGYSDASSITRIFARNADEFTDGMAASVKLTDPNGDLQETRIFSLRGCHLLAMFAKTEIAKDFRRWVLDILDREVQPVPNLISPAQQNELQQIVKYRCRTNSGLYQYLWGRFNNRFHLGSYKQLPAQHFEEGKAFLATLPASKMAKSEPLPAPVSVASIDTKLSEVAILLDAIVRLSSGDAVIANLSGMAARAVRVIQTEAA